MWASDMDRRKDNVVSVTIKENAYEVMRDRALKGLFAPGSRISEVSLSKELGVSRTPVREAISQLIHEGLFEQVPNEGTFMKKPNRIELEDLYQMREWVESGVAAEAAKNISPEQVPLLEAACAESLSIARNIRKAGKGRNAVAIIERCVKTDLAFHMTLIQISGNRLAMKTVGENHILSRVWATHPDSMPDLHVKAWVYRDHARILRFVRRGDSAGAARAMTMHIRRGREQTLQRFGLMQRRQAVGLGQCNFWPNSVLESALDQENRPDVDQ